jgi:hypothetical protein
MITTDNWLERLRAFKRRSSVTRSFGSKISWVSILGFWSFRIALDTPYLLFGLEIVEIIG